MLITVVDYGVGNLRSIAKSIEKANSDNNFNYSIKVSSNVNDIKKSDKIVLPGQGSFKACKEGIDKITGLQETLNESVLIKKKPIYGICAGMQLFATTGHEEEETEGTSNTEDEDEDQCPSRGAGSSRARARGCTLPSPQREMGKRRRRGRRRVD